MGMIADWYDKKILPFMIDKACGMKAIGQQRAKVVPRARGRVLEIGIGTGLNLCHYDAAQVTELLGLDPAMQMHALARKRMKVAGLSVELLGLPANTIPLADASIDTLVMTFTLCTIPEPLPALREMRRVLKPDGVLLFCEHGVAPDAHIHRWQNRIQPLWGPLAGGCHLNRDIPALLREAGFKLDELNTGYVPGPKIFTYNYWGQAYRG